MLHILRAHKLTGILHTEGRSNVLGSKSFYDVEVTLSDGDIVSCRVVDRKGRSQFAGADALQILSNMGILDWTLTTQSKEVLLTQPSSSPLEIPYRTVAVEQHLLNRWPRLHRRVFALVDGTNTTQKIALVLSLPIEHIKEVLADLQAMNVIGIGYPH
jgi:hypothetical protein